MNETKTYRLGIFHDTYTVRSDEPEARVRQASHLVDSLMQEIADAAPHTDTTKIAVLAALRIASTLLNEEKASQDQQEKLQALVETVGQALEGSSSVFI